MTVEDLPTLIAEERACLMSGRLDRLAELAARKEAAIAALAVRDLSPRGRARLRAGLEHNQRLMAAARDGIEAARSRFAAILAVQRDGGIYDASGAKVRLGTGVRDIERRA